MVKEAEEKYEKNTAINLEMMEKVEKVQDLQVEEVTMKAVI